MTRAGAGPRQEAPRPRIGYAAIRWEETDGAGRVVAEGYDAKRRVGGEPWSEARTLARFTASHWGGRRGWPSHSLGGEVLMRDAYERAVAYLAAYAGGGAERQRAVAGEAEGG